MDSWEKSLEAILAMVRAKKAKKALEPAQIETFERNVKDLLHALRVKDIRRIKAKVNEIAKIFLHPEN